MNICFLQGKIISEINFNFLYNSNKNISISTFYIIENEKINNNYNKTPIKIKAYDENADKIYQYFENGNMIAVVGKLREDSVEIEDVIKY